ncbi:MAG: carboxymuconolactone decarboxylase family protein [Oxalobacteraceae bacterium]|nr:MAG: carboxymuconolactone decarboxylase family protein [Oxalobacteraceae bacterium]
MARIPYFDLEKAPQEYRDMLAGRPPLNLYRMLPHATSIAPGFLAMGRGILRESALDPKIREIVILRVGMLSDASYELHQHKRVARRVGLSEEKIAALQAGADEPVFDHVESKVIRFTDEVVRNVKATNQAFDVLQSDFSHREIAEIVLTIGFYMMVCRFLENFEVDIEPPGVIE